MSTWTMIQLFLTHDYNSKGSEHLVSDLLPPVSTHCLTAEQVRATEVREHLDPQLKWQLLMVMLVQY